MFRKSLQGVISIRSSCNIVCPLKFSFFYLFCFFQYKLTDWNDSNAFSRKWKQSRSIASLRVDLWNTSLCSALVTFNKCNDISLNYLNIDFPSSFFLFILSSYSYSSSFSPFSLMFTSTIIIMNNFSSFYPMPSWIPPLPTHIQFYHHHPVKDIW